MHLIEQDGRDARQFGIRLYSVAKNPFGQNKNARARRVSAFHAGCIAHQRPNGRVQLVCNALCRCACGQAAGGEQQDLPRAPGLIEKRRGHSSCLPRAGRGNEHGIGTNAKRCQ